MSGVRRVFDYFTMLSLEVEHQRRESTYGGRVNPSEIGYSPDDRANLPELGYSPDGPQTKLIKPKCPNTSHSAEGVRESTYGSCLGILF